MKLKSLLFGAFLLSVAQGGLHAQQPFGGCWHPDYIRNWTPEADMDAKFNRSTVSLQPRFKNETVKANQYQRYDGQLTACLTMNPSCSQTPSQGANNFIGYNPTYWQYMDILVWWGGSASEGIIIPPSAPVVDIAHLNGVKVLGQLFFPPTAFGGESKWVAQILTVENGKYIYAEKLYQIAKYYGFDGWFINEETNQTYGSAWSDFFKYYFQLADADGNSHHQIQWYDMSINIRGKEDMFIAEPRFSYFADYGSPNYCDSNWNIFQSWGIKDKSRFLTQVFHGVECAQRGIDGNADNFRSCFPKEAHAGSIDLFNPEEGAWKDVVRNLLGTENACGSMAYSKMKTVFKNEGRFWTNEDHDPTNTSDRDAATWPGLANALMERSAIQSKPFVTSFSAGLGKHRFVNGEKKGTQDWYHRGMQDVLPTWRWWIENNETDKLQFDLNWDDAYNVGTSLLVKGKLTANTDHITRLYKTNLVVASGDKLQLVYKTATSNSMEVKLAIAENENAFSTFPVVATSTNNGWSVADIDISSLNGKTVSVIALNFKSNTTVSDYQVILGQLGIMAASYNPTVAPVTNLINQYPLKEGTSDLRMVWDAPVSADVHHYNVYLEKDGVKKLVGQTRNEGFYISKFERISPEEKHVKVSVAVVTKDLREGGATELTIDYPSLGISEVRLKAMKTLVPVGEEVAIVARATNFPLSYKWIVPENAILVRQNNDSAFFKFNAPAIYDIRVQVTNAQGVADKTESALVDVSDLKKLENVSVKKSILSYSSAMEGSGEYPKWIIDGATTNSGIHQKWCAGGDKSHWVIIDLEEVYKVYRFQWFDCGIKENPNDNIKNYRIELSENGSDWTEVVSETNRPENIKNDYIKAMDARYVRFAPYDEEMPIIIRVWEFEVYGIESNLALGTPGQKDVFLNARTSVAIPYSLGGDAKESNFGVTVISSANNIVTIENLKVEDESINLDLVTHDRLGSAFVTTTVVNGKWSKTTKFEVNVLDPDNANVLVDKIPVITPKHIYYDEPNVETNTTGAIGAKGVTDTKLNTWWSSPCDMQGFITPELVFDLQGTYELNSFRALFDKHGYLEYPSAIEIYASPTSDDADSYELVATYNTQLGKENKIALDKPVTAKYLKVLITTARTFGFSLAEFEAYGKKLGGSVNLESVEDNRNVEIYPNPVKKNGVLKVKTDDASFIRLMSLQGATLTEREVTGNLTELSVENIPEGVYLLVIRGVNGIQTAKVIIGSK
ncbi:MAG: discoidin domain-containing protein [Bacteroidales bacterium]